MTKTQLAEIIMNGENSGIEFKRDTIDNRALAKEIVAFSNLNGGHVLLGVDDDGAVVGITRPKIEEWVMTLCRDKIRPEIIPYFEIISDVEPGKNVAIVSVDRGWTVHHVWHNNHRTYYVRVGTQSREASWEELERLSQQRGSFRVESRPVSGSSLADLDRRRLRDYFDRVREQEIPAEQPDADWPRIVEARANADLKERRKVEGEVEAGSDYAQVKENAEAQWHEEVEARWQALLVNTEILSEKGSHCLSTVAGLLLFGKNPNRYLPQAGIDAVAYPGLEKDYASIERAQLRGPIVGLFQQRNGGVDIIEPGLVEQAAYFVRRNTGVTASLQEGTIRVERTAYPEEVIREAVVNAVTHRDYLLSATDIELSIYKNRLEIISPGRLPNGITPERMKVGCRAARNQLLKDVMRDYGYLEHMGMGIPRKIIRGMREHNGTEPDLIEDGERFILRLWKEKKQ